MQQYAGFNMGGFLSHADEASFELAEYSRETICKLNGATPRVLYHYTSQNGLLGILESGVLRLGTLDWTDDKTEVMHAAGVFRCELDKVFLTDGLDERGKELLAAMRRELNRPLRISNVYSMSVSEDGNNEQLWKLYSEAGSGFAIGIPQDAFLSATEHPHWAEVWRVSYGKDVLERYCAEALRVILETYLSRFDRGHEAYPAWFPPVDQMALAYLREISHFAAAFKASDWSYQQEWRWAVIQPPEEDSMTRHLPLPLPLRYPADETCLPICSITAGPRCNERIILNVTNMLEPLGYSNVNFRRV